MTKQEILISGRLAKRIKTFGPKTVDHIYAAMDEYAKQESLEFFKWYGLKVTALCHYLTEIKPLVTSDELEAKIEEFEGKPLNTLYELYQQSKNNQP